MLNEKYARSDSCMLNVESENVFWKIFKKIVDWDSCWRCEKEKIWCIILVRKNMKCQNFITAKKIKLFSGWKVENFVYVL